MSKKHIDTIIEIALAEDTGYGDITSELLIPAELYGKASLLVKARGVLSGGEVAKEVFLRVDPALNVELLINEGTNIKSGDIVATITGRVISILKAERVALNFLQRLSGIASETARYIRRTRGFASKVTDTRKTTPGLRSLEKNAVRVGGGQNHRLGLYDMVLIKNNHIDGAGGIEAAVAQVREMHGDRYPIEVEVRTLSELEAALALRPTRIMLDNMDLDTMRRAVKISGGRVPLEASGNVNLKTVKDIAETGVDYISVGSLTHSAPAMDVSMHIESLQGS